MTKIRIEAEKNPNETLDFKVTFKGRPILCTAVEVEFDLDKKEYVYLDGGKTDDKS